MPKDKLSKKSPSSTPLQEPGTTTDTDKSSTTNNGNSMSAEVMNELLNNSSFIECIVKAVQKVIKQSVDDSVSKLKIAMSEREESLKELVERNASTLHDIQVTIENKLTEIDHLQSEVGKQKETISSLTSNLNSLEQYTRRNNIRIFGVAEQRDENTDQLVSQVAEKLGVRVAPTDIDRSHRVGPPPSQDHAYADALRSTSGKSKHKARPIIVKFTSYKIKKAIMNERRKLKGSKTVIAEDLTKSNARLLTAAYTNRNTTAAWSIDGRIFAVVKDANNREKKKVITCLSDLNHL